MLAKLKLIEDKREEEKERKAKPKVETKKQEKKPKVGGAYINFVKEKKHSFQRSNEKKQAKPIKNKNNLAKSLRSYSDGIRVQCSCLPPQRGNRASRFAGIHCSPETPKKSAVSSRVKGLHPAGFSRSEPQELGLPRTMKLEPAKSGSAALSG